MPAWAGRMDASAAAGPPTRGPPVVVETHGALIFLWGDEAHKGQAARVGGWDLAVVLLAAYREASGYDAAPSRRTGDSLLRARVRRSDVVRADVVREQTGRKSDRYSEEAVGAVYAEMLVRRWAEREPGPLPRACEQSRCQITILGKRAPRTETRGVWSCA